MSILDQGCTCLGCLASAKQVLQEAREKWNNGEREIRFKPFNNRCGDGCCDIYGTDVYVNGFQIITSDGENMEHVLENLMEFLEIDNVNIDYEYEDEG